MKKGGQNLAHFHCYIVIPVVGKGIFEKGGSKRRALSLLHRDPRCRGKSFEGTCTRYSAGILGTERHGCEEKCLFDHFSPLESKKINKYCIRSRAWRQGVQLAAGCAMTETGQRTRHCLRQGAGRPLEGCRQAWGGLGSSREYFWGVPGGSHNHLWRAKMFIFHYT